MNDTTNTTRLLTQLHARLIRQLEADAVLGDFHTALQAAAEIKAVADAIAALSPPALDAPVVAPVGFVLVPREPTEDMLTSVGTMNNYDIDAGGRADDDHIAWWKSMLAASPVAAQAVTGGALKLDTDSQVFFYEQDFYVLSNFSSFTLDWKGQRFATSEAAYHWEKFDGTEREVQEMILDAPSAHEAFKIAESQRVFRRHDWDDIKVPVMREILRAKVEQHEYVRRKLLATGSRELIENSWRDDYWGWGPNRDGRNMLGKLWMEIRAELLAAHPNAAPCDAQGAES